ncbi:CPCC family cysteine-rich protein [Halalkalibacter alkaliphilus]|uniref:Cysteine-rich CPCC domain-containing protein n=1 Tax=Halalkalibacter alkaliphilus TaxID=2917993 RepID=A0A9X2CSF1_9BACI|nr:hypothetical protein [Halalkalibacter alkaliphilus]
MKKNCLCCNYKTLDSDIFDICEVCGWQDDPTCWDHPDSLSGANGGISLWEAQKNYKEIGACNEVMLKFKKKIEKSAKRFAQDKELYDYIENLVAEDANRVETIELKSQRQINENRKIAREKRKALIKAEIEKIRRGMD